MLVDVGGAPQSVGGGRFYGRTDSRLNNVTVYASRRARVLGSDIIQPRASDSSPFSLRARRLALHPLSSLYHHHLLKMRRHTNGRKPAFQGAKLLNKSTLAPAATPPPKRPPKTSKPTTPRTSQPPAGDDEAVPEKDRNKRKMAVVQSEDEDVDEDEDTGTQVARKPKEGEPRTKKARRAVSPQRERERIAQEDLPFLIRKLEHLNINDK